MGSIPTGATATFWACRLTGRRSACTRQMRVQLPPRSTVRNWPGGGMADTRSSEGRAHRGVRVQVPPWSLFGERWCLWCNWQACDPVKVEAAGSTPPEHPASAALSCGFKRRLSEGWLAGSTPAWGAVGCLADIERWVYEARLAGSTPARPTPGQALGRGLRL